MARTSAEQAGNGRGNGMNYWETIRAASDVAAAESAGGGQRRCFCISFKTPTAWFNSRGFSLEWGRKEGVRRAHCLVQDLALPCMWNERIPTIERGVLC
jgi:hypothetical protein